ncbi:hypothetical protein ABZP36_021155 [Zizania latifolia]
MVLAGPSTSAYLRRLNPLLFSVVVAEATTVDMAELLVLNEDAIASKLAGYTSSPHLPSLPLARVYPEPRAPLQWHSRAPPPPWLRLPPPP